MESVVKDKSSAAGENFSSIEEIIFRYTALKETNKDLVNEKQEISEKSEHLSVEEKKEMNKLRMILFEEQKIQ